MIMKKIILAFLFLYIIALSSQGIWHDIRFSAVTIDDEIAVRCEIIDEHESSLLYDTENGIEEQPMIEIIGQAHTFQGYMIAPQDDVGPMGFRTLLLDPSPGIPSIHVIPVCCLDINQPELENLTWLTDDAIGDIPFADTFLDLISSYACFDEEKLYLAMRNNGGGYPVSQAIWGPFFSYMAIIAGPDEDFIPFGLLYTVDQPPVIQPGLYKIHGTGMDDLEQIGSIEAVIDESNDLLILQCLWTDLLDDPDFTAWFDTNSPEMHYIAATSKITLTGGLQEADFVQACALYPNCIMIVTQENILPVISDLHITLQNHIAVSYLDENANFALTAVAVINDTCQIELYPQSHDFTETVLYESMESHPLIINNEWEHLNIIFSDNNIDYIELNIENDTFYTDDLLPVIAKELYCYPNPFNPSTTIFYLNNSGENRRQKLEIYNAKGQKIKELIIDAKDTEVIWDGRNEMGEPVASGIYYLLSQTAGLNKALKMLLLR
jgi:hypothetical protein